jgi:hypothetical protein
MVGNLAVEPQPAEPTVGQIEGPLCKAAARSECPCGNQAAASACCLRNRRRRPARSTSAATWRPFKTRSSASTAEGFRAKIYTAARPIEEEGDHHPRHPWEVNAAG